MTEEQLIRRVGNQKPILNRSPWEFESQQMVYRRLSFDCARDIFAWKVREKPTKKETHSDFKDIASFAEEILKGGYKFKGKDKEEKKALDIKISRHAYIIIELPLNWSFTSVVPGVTLGYLDGQVPDEDAYGELRYVVLGQTPSAKPISDCRLVYFSALNQPGDDQDPYTQALNFNIVTPDGVTILVDPDIRFPGNGTS